jgi:hypothetical protein
MPSLINLIQNSAKVWYLLNLSIIRKKQRFQGIPYGTGTPINELFSVVCIPEKTTFMIKFVAPLLIVGYLIRGSRTIYKRNLCQLRKVI